MSKQKYYQPAGSTTAGSVSHDGRCGTRGTRRSRSGALHPDSNNVLTEEIPAIYAFLREALRLVEAGQPFRGPGTHQQGEYLYWNESPGNLTRFTGREAVYHGSLLVYELRYHGGLLR